ncbi:MAG: hypothetical protein DRP64_09445, partial [Verrucomicrobia bacterium]
MRAHGKCTHLFYSNGWKFGDRVLSVFGKGEVYMIDRQIMAISVMAKDRPGIVAEVTAGISALDGNLADLRESVLCGYFTMILIAGF